MESDELLNIEVEEWEPLGEMATVADTDRPIGLSVNVNPDPSRIGNPYFKVYNAKIPKQGESKIARLHFLDDKMEYHQDKYKDWILTNKEISLIKDFLKEKHFTHTRYTNWQVACFLWNQEYHFISQRDIHDYMAGLYDDKFVNDKRYPSYVPSTTLIPETWVYELPKGKNKRK